MNGERWLALLIAPLLVVLMSCGGGGGGGGQSGDGTEALPYTGLASPAALDDSNVVAITELALSDRSDFETFVPDITGAALGAGTARKAGLAVRSALEYTAQKASSTETWTEFGPCGGRMDISLTVNESTLEFSGTIAADDFCEEGETLDGDMSLSGLLESAGSPTLLTIRFDLVTLTDAEEDITISGTVSEDLTGTPPELNITLNLRDNDSGKIYRLEDYLIKMAHAEQGTAETVTGRFYHPDYGFVDVITLEPFIFTGNGDLPISGAAVCQGSASRKSKFTALSDAAYTISGDFDGVGDFDDFSTGVLHYPGKNNQPEISAGSDTWDNLGCGTLTTSGASAVDADTDPLDIAWTFASKPMGSATALSGGTTLTPSFTPDLTGQYVLKLTVTDGIGATVEDTATMTVYGDLFCLKDSTFLPMAQASKPSAVEVGDVTGDGLNDVVLLTSSTDSIDSDPNQDYHLYVLEQTGQGTLLAPASYAAGDGHSLTLADLNGDGRNDAAVSSRSGVGVFHQTPQGTMGTMQLFPFEETVEVYEPHAVISADFTGDGRADLASVYSDFTAAKIRLYPQNAGGGLNLPSLFTTDPGEWDAQAVDLGGDGKTDLLLTGNTFGKGFVYIGAFAKLLTQSSGTLTPPTPYLFDNSLSPTAFCSASFAVAPLNGDDRPDLATSCLTTPGDTTYLRLYPQQVDGTPGEPTAVTAPASYGQLEAADLTGDTLDELIGLVSGNEMVFDVFRQGGTGPGPAETYPAWLPNYNYSGQAFAVGDVNGDGIPDIVTGVFQAGDYGNGLLLIPGNPNRQ